MGGDGGKYSRRKYVSVLESLSKRYPDKFVLKSATKEMYKIIWLSKDARRPYPIAANHGGISEGIAGELGKLLEKYGVCTKKAFLDMIK